MVLINFKKFMIYVPSRSLLDQSTNGCIEFTDLWISSCQPSKSTGIISNECRNYDDSVEGLPAEGAITSVDLALRRPKRLLPVAAGSWEYVKAQASSRELVIADIMVSVFPKPISSASIPPLGEESGFANIFDPRIACR